MELNNIISQVKESNTKRNTSKRNTVAKPTELSNAITELNKQNKPSQK